ncbi:uncharacterized protein [Clytia hemisphaerica]|uniref:Cupin-like domain-containing protein n=1 Tax=Clytia hemisphaerica TaxID=252671 RepID=A0A7M5XBB7_9CNID
MAARASRELNNLFLEAVQNGLKNDDMKKTVDQKNMMKMKHTAPPVNWYKYAGIVGLVGVLMVLQVPKEMKGQYFEYYRAKTEAFFNLESSCLVHGTDLTIEMARPPVDCSVCNGISEVPIAYNMTKEYFIKHHAYSGVPVLIKGGVKHWSALETFDYKYFKQVYDDDALREFDDKPCQFFAYKTNFRTLEDVFSMSKKRAALKKDQWYVGWSNCVDKVQTLLRKHYERPEFLPDDSESSSLDWIFMGGSGTGAMMHIDSVNRPSWQAMIKGKKTWYIEAPPECFNSCPTKRMNATMDQGDILVVDTNKWYHSTFIHPEGGLAITIGSEYD